MPDLLDKFEGLALLKDLRHYHDQDKVEVRKRLDWKYTQQMNQPYWMKARDDALLEDAKNRVDKASMAEVDTPEGSTGSIEDQ